MRKSARLLFLIPVILTGLILTAGAQSDPQDLEASDSKSDPQEVEPAPRIKVLLTGFENDVEHNLRATVENDFLEIVRSKNMVFVTLDTTRDYIAGVTKSEADLNAAKLAERQGFHFVVWGGTSGLVSDVAITAGDMPKRAGGEEGGYKRFHDLGFTQHFQFHLDVKFSELHEMVSKALGGLVLLRIGEYGEAAELLERSLAYDRGDVFGLSALRYYAGCARMAKLLKSEGIDEKDLKSATLHWHKVLDWIRPLTESKLYGAIKANLAFLFAEMADRAPESREKYLHRSRSALEEAKKIFKKKDPELYRALESLEDKLSAP